MALTDISRTISPATAVWPGDQDVEWTWTARTSEEDASVNLGAACLSMHTGTHADAPLHIDDAGRSVDELPLDAFVGPALVVEVGDAPSVRPEHVPEYDESGPARVLFKTPASGLASHEWPNAVVPIHPETVRYLSDNGVVLIGTDAPSVDPLDSTDLPAHHALLEAEIVSLEGLALAEVSPGPYELVALPLKFSGADAAPVRAALRDAPSQ